MNEHSRRFLLSLWLTSALTSIAVADSATETNEARLVRPGQSGSKLKDGKLFVDPEACLRLTNGLGFHDAKLILGTDGDHLFTVVRGGVEYRLTGYLINIQEGIGMWVLFRDKKLFKIVEWFRMSRKSPRIEDESTVDIIIEAPDMGPEKVRQKLDAIKSAPQPPSQPQVQIPPEVADLFFKRSQIQKAQKRISEAQKKNAELLKIYNGHRVDLGMSIKEVDSLFGVPNRSLMLTNGMTARIYDPPGREQLEGDLYHLTRFSPVAVVFESGKASRVFSNSFFVRSWLPRTWR